MEMSSTCGIERPRENSDQMPRPRAPAVDPVPVTAKVKATVWGHQVSPSAEVLGAALDPGTRRHTLAVTGFVSLHKVTRTRRLRVSQLSISLTPTYPESLFEIARESP